MDKQDGSSKYTRYFRNAYEAFQAEDWEAFEKMGGFEIGMFETPFEGYQYQYPGCKSHDAANAIYLLSFEYTIV